MRDWGRWEMKHKINRRINTEFVHIRCVWGFIIFTHWNLSIKQFKTRNLRDASLHRIVKMIQITAGLTGNGTGFIFNTLLVWFVKMWNVRSREKTSCLNASEKHKQDQGMRKIICCRGPIRKQWRVEQLISPAGSRKLFCSQYTCRTGAKEKQGVLQNTWMD